MVFKNKLKDLLSLGVLNISSSIIFSIFWLYLASILTKEEYGELGFFVSIASVGATISLLGLRSVIVVYESKNENVFTSSFFVVLISSIITSSITYVLTQNVIVSLLIVGMVIFQIILSGLNSREKYRSFSKHKIFRALITVVIALLAFQIFGMNGILLGYFLSTLFILIELNSLIKNRKLQFSILKSKINFILHAYSGRLTEVFVRWGDKILIGSLFGFSFLASYHVAFQYVLLLIAIPESLSIYLLPQESRGIKNKNIKIFSIAVSCTIAIISILFIPYGINTFLPQYGESVITIQILSLAIIPFTINTIQKSEFFGKENSRAVLIGSALQATFYLSSIILMGERFGLNGLAIGFVLALVARTIFNIFMKNDK